ncbi:MAG: ABC transporter permease, partial [Prosthecobacter sp.]|nr:ABC transporter permease [Prosthecobacter sp.]
NPSRRQEMLLSALPMAWLLVFFLAPCVMLLAYAFRSVDAQGSAGTAWTLETVRSLADPVYLPVLARTLGMSAICTLVCVGLAVPVSLHMARSAPHWRSVLLLLVVLPFLTNLVIRIFAWRSLLHPEGLVKRLLVALHLASEDTQLLNNPGAVLLVMVFTQLPFAILPMYAAAEKFDLQLLDAARDLGASGWQAVRRVFLPGVREGLISATVLMMVGCLGQYVVPQFVGGAGDEMLGNKIVQRAFADRNLPLACAMAGSLLLAVLLCLLALRLLSARREQRQTC